jgi:putative ABC transport system permease protein
VNVLRVKLRRDLRADASRFVLMTAAVAISLTVFGGVLSAWAAIGRETEAAYVGTGPASATILLDRGVDAEAMAAIVTQTRTRPQVLDATGRTQFAADVEVDGTPRDLSMQLYVAAPDDPMRMATFDVRGGNWPPAPDEVFVRRDSLDLLDTAVGDTMTVRPPNGPPVRLRVAGTVYDPSLSPSPQEQRGNGYVSTAAAPMPLDQLKVQVGEPGANTPTRDRDTVMAVAAGLGDWLRREHDLVVREIQVPEPYAHPHQWQADALLLSLLAGAAAALLLGTILVAAMLNTLFARQIPQIGIMKATGAGSGRIARFYLAMTLVVAGAATTVAIGPVVLLGRFGVERFSGFLGIEPVSLAAPWWCYATTLAVGLLLPPAMALWPVLRTSRTTVRAAIDHHGLGAHPRVATRLLTRVGRLPRGLLMAVRNTLRRPARSVLSIGLLAAAGTVFVAGVSLSAGLGAVAVERDWDVDVQLAGGAPAAEVDALVSGVQGVSRVEGRFRVPVGVAGPGELPFTRTYPDQGHGGVMMSTVSATAARPELLEGRWLRPAETGAVVLNQIARDNTVPGTRAGDTVTLVVEGRTTTWRVVGIVEEREGLGGVYATADGLAAATGKTARVNELRVHTDGDNETARDALAAAVRDTLTRAGIDVRSAASVSRGEAVGDAHLAPVILILLAIAVPLGVIGAIGLAATTSANVLDRTREFAVLHAIGARPRTVRRIVLAEGLVLALVSGVVAIGPALGLTAVLGTGLGTLFFTAPLPYRISVPAIGIWLALTVLATVLATRAAAGRAARLTVREALM